jgi:hypothetical protein
LDAEFLVLSNVKYIHKMDHRNQSDEKSQWIISKTQERDCFVNAMTSGWNLPIHHCWGLHFEDGKVSYVGITARNEPETHNLFIAKFVDSNQNDRWHGYPADPSGEKQQDIPPEPILKLWLQEEYLRGATIRKLSRGQKCRL